MKDPFYVIGKTLDGEIGHVIFHEEFILAYFADGRYNLLIPIENLLKIIPQKDIFVLHFNRYYNQMSNDTINSHDIDGIIAFIPNEKSVSETKLKSYFPSKLIEANNMLIAISEKISELKASSGMILASGIHWTGDHKKNFIRSNNKNQNGYHPKLVYDLFEYFYNIDYNTFGLATNQLKNGKYILLLIAPTNNLYAYIVTEKHALTMKANKSFARINISGDISIFDLGKFCLKSKSPWDVFGPSDKKYIELTGYNRSQIKRQWGF